MRRLISTLLAFSATAILLAACTADLKEGCLAGGCPSMDATSATASSSSGSGSGGGGGASCGPVPMTGDIPCDVFMVIHDVCDKCHVDPPLVGAPFPILKFADTQMPFDTHGKLIAQRMHEVIQDDGSPHMPLKSNKIPVDPLTPDQFKTLSDWTACPQPVPAGMGCACPGMGCN